MNQVYLDNSATTFLLPNVKKIIQEEIELCGNAASTHNIGLSQKIKIDNARKNIANDLNIKENGIIFTTGATESNNAIINHVVKTHSAPIHVISTVAEHPSILEPLLAREREGKILVSLLPVYKDGKIKIEDFVSFVRPSTKFVSIQMVNSETGAINDILSAQKFCKENGIFFHSDLTQSMFLEKTFSIIPYLDSFSLSGHKIGTPVGTGMLYVSPEYDFVPFVLGGGQQNNLRSGTDNVMFIRCLEEALSFVKKNNKELEGFFKELREYFVKLIENYPININFNGAPHILNCFIDTEYENDVVQLLLSSGGVYVSTGTACHSGDLKASKGLLSTGMEQERAIRSIRISLSTLNSKQDLDILCDKINKIE